MMASLLRATRACCARLYRFSLMTLPQAMRRKHGEAMMALFAHEMDRAEARGMGWSMLTATMAIGDVLWRGVYEHVRNDWNADTSVIDANAGDHVPLIPPPLTLLRRLAGTFVKTFAVLTGAFLLLSARRLLPDADVNAAPWMRALEVAGLSVPYTAAITIPMSVFLAVFLVVSRLPHRHAHAVTPSEPLAPHGVPRAVLLPVLTAAAGVATVMLVLTAELVPRANLRLASVLAGHVVQPSDRSMTLQQLQHARQRATGTTSMESVPGISPARAASYGVEIHKKYALAASCIVLAFFAAVLGLRLPNAGRIRIAGISIAAFGVCYACLMIGESLADALVVSPPLAMWAVNEVMLWAALTVWWGSRRRSAMTRA